ncbi:hypothetical protein FBU59_001302 [Linderina macrospora]|uniref:Uncharacterized protein n=1 Tax=Linderina macrospora TaxID=4868 RepID=A0ACC1JEC5_9FUNG|nr:hypothetical protein FBU59_001302 [Linderina macrospora]
MSVRGDGRMTCKYGHMQEGVVVEGSEDYVQSSRKRQGTSTRKAGKWQLRREKRLYGDDARFLILQILQLILKRQVQALVQDLGAPSEITGVVRNLWLMYTTKMENIRFPTHCGVLDADDGDEEDEEEERSSARGGSARKSQQNSELVTADSLFRQYTQTQDDSIDVFLRNVEEDIVRDEEEMAEWEERHGGTDTVHEDSVIDALSAPEDNAAGARARRRTKATAAGQKYEDLIERSVHMEFLPAIIHLGFAWLRYPVSVGDMVRLMADESIPYVNAAGLIPESLKGHMTRVAFNLVNGLSIPGSTRLRSISIAFEHFYQRHYSIDFPAIEPPIQILSLLKRLNMDLRFYPVVMRIVEAARIDIACVMESRALASYRAFGAIIVALQLHYGLDEIGRVPSEETEQFADGLPTLQQFLDKWCEDWEREAPVSVFPALATVDKHRLEAYTGYAKRMLDRETVPLHLERYRELGRRYKYALEKVALDFEGSAGKAGQILPAEFVSKYFGTQAEIQTGASSPVHSQEDNAVVASEQLAELERRLVPIRMPILGAARSGERMRQFSTIAQPLTNHKDLGLKSGRLQAIISRQRQTPGYSIPVLGLVVARCAMLAGITQEMMYTQINLVNYKLFADEIQLENRTPLQARHYYMRYLV